MIPTQQLETFQTFAETGSKSKPSDEKYVAGFVPADVLPAEWENWLWNKASIAITKHAAGLTSVETELNNIVEVGGGTPSESAGNQVLNAIKYLIAEAKTEAISDAHPIGSVEIRVDSKNPGTLYGGTWEQISQGRVIIGAGSGKDSNNISKSFSLGSTGGEYNHTLTSNEMPQHTHTFTGTAHTHTFTGTAHTHTFTGTAHTHTFTGSSATTSSQSSSTTGNESAHEKYSWTGSHAHNFTLVHMSTDESSTKVACHYFDFDSSNNYPYVALNKNATFNTTSSNWAMTTKGQIRTTNIGFSVYGSGDYEAKYISILKPWISYKDDSLQPIKITDTSMTVSGTCTGDHTHSYSHTHNLTARGSNANATAGGSNANATAGGTNANTTAGGSNSNTGGSASHNNVQPYLVCNIWKRTA